MSYREVFKPSPEDNSDPGKIFYTITPDDVGKGVITTTAGHIRVTDVLDRVLPGDVGKRLYRVQNNAEDSWLWQAENNRQRDERLSREP